MVSKSGEMKGRVCRKRKRGINNQLQRGDKRETCTHADAKREILLSSVFVTEHDEDDAHARIFHNGRSAELKENI